MQRTLECASNGVWRRRRRRYSNWNTFPVCIHLSIRNVCGMYVSSQGVQSGIPLYGIAQHCTEQRHTHNLHWKFLNSFSTIESSMHLATTNIATFMILKPSLRVFVLFGFPFPSLSFIGFWFEMASSANITTVRVRLKCILHFKACRSAVLIWIRRHCQRCPNTHRITCALAMVESTLTRRCCCCRCLLLLFRSVASHSMCACSRFTERANDAMATGWSETETATARTCRIRHTHRAVCCASSVEPDSSLIIFRLDLFG